MEFDVMSLILDRTAADVALAAERNKEDYAATSAAAKAEYDAGLRGAYSYVDLNRVGTACAWLYDTFRAAGRSVPGYAALRTDWQPGEELTEADQRRYVTTVGAFNRIAALGAPLPDDLRELDAETANIIERVLYFAWEPLPRAARAAICCGEAFAGEF